MLLICESVDFFNYANIGFVVHGNFNTNCCNITFSLISMFIFDIIVTNCRSARI